MVPRREICAIPEDMPLDDILAIMTQEKYTRFPVFSGDKDHVIGMLNKSSSLQILCIKVKRSTENSRLYISSD